MRDYSEYRDERNTPENTRQLIRRYLRFEYFNNRSYFVRDTGKMNIHVGIAGEWPAVKQYCDEYETSDDGEKEEIAAFIEAHNTEDEDERQNDLERCNAVLTQFQSKFDVRTKGAIEYFGDFYAEQGMGPHAPNNALAGTEIRFQAGEGLLDFLYADFETPFRALKERNQTFQYIGSEAFLKDTRDDAEESDEDDLSPEAIQKLVNDVFIPSKEPRKIYTEFQDVIETYRDYETTMIMASNLIYASLYTAICPPVFYDGSMDTKALVIYYNYIKKLQKDYLELMEFCFDQDYYPEVLGDYLPFERYYLYCRIHDKPFMVSRQEDFSLSVKRMQGDRQPFGMTKEEIIQRITMDVPETEQHRQFAAAYNMEVNDLIMSLKVPHFINTSNPFSTADEALELEFTKMLEHDQRFRRCRRCGKYFVMKPGFEANYCTRIAEGQTRTCQELAAQENYKLKTAGQEELRVYMKYYKRFSARVKAGTISEEDFRKWKYAAITQRDACANGEITLEAFTAWLEGCFPKHKKEKKSKWYDMF